MSTRAREFRFFVLTVILIALAGCGGGKAKLSQKVERISEEKTQVQDKVTQLERENVILKEQAETLANLPGDKRSEALYKLKAVEIGKYTNLFDEDKDGIKETLVIYVRPIDETGDAIKAAGIIDVELWDLSKNESEAKLTQWRIESEELKKLWLNSVLVGGNYRLAFDMEGIITQPDELLTVKVTFTDYLSGRTFTEQKAIKP